MKFSPTHIVVLLVLVLLIFGSSKLPDIARSVGQSMKVFKKEIKDLREEDDDTQPKAQIQQPQEGTYYTRPTQPGQSAAQSPEGSAQQ